MSTLIGKQLCGIVPPMVTPLVDRDTLDRGGAERLIEHILTGGVAGLFVLGTTGEGPSLSYKLRRELVDLAAKQVRGRVPLLVGITDTSLSEAVALARHAADAGASGCVMAPPYYQPISQGELWRYTRALASELPLPLILYEMPSHTKVNFSLEIVRKAMDLANVIGLKDSGGNLSYFTHLLELRAAHRPDWTTLCGPEELLGPSVLIGGNGGVNGGANVFPRIYVEVYNAAVAGDLPRLKRAEANLLRVFEALYNLTQDATRWIRGIKAALWTLGICNDASAEPLDRLPDEVRAQMKVNLHAVRTVVPSVAAT